jgi:hypothetical protein
MIAARFGFDLTADEVLTLLLAMEALSGVWTWQRVTPTPQPLLPPLPPLPRGPR